MFNNFNPFHAVAVLVISSVCVFMFPSKVSADIISINPDRDNTLYERVAGDLSNGTGPSLFFGQTGGNAGEVLRRALFRFDVSSIPPGSTVQNVTLSITVDLVPPTPTAFDAPLHRVEADWGEGNSFAPGAGGGGTGAATGDATWLHTFFDDQFWTSAGGDFDAVPSSIVSLNNAVGEFMFPTTAQLIADVQAWVDQPAQNFGWILLGQENNPQNARRIGSRENTLSPPTLTIEFERAAALPEPQTVPVLSSVSMLVLAALLMMMGLLVVRSGVRS